MIITAVDDNKDLFLVENIFPEDFLLELNSLDYKSWPGHKESWQEQYNRLRLANNNTLQKFDLFIKNNLETINHATGIDAAGCDTGFWLDGPNFTMTSHIDNSDVYATMQIYLIDTDQCPGTYFTNRYLFKYKKNTGYIMINTPTQYHEVEYPVPSGKHRLCSYTWFYPKI